MTLINRIHSLLMQGSVRSVKVKKNIIGSFLLKGINILITLLIVPLTIGYVNSDQYGIWLTVSSIVAWFSYFDLGFAHGFRNRFAEAKANGNIILQKEYVSTTYLMLFIIFSIILIVFLIINYFIDWSVFLNLEANYRKELQVVFAVLSCFFCLNIVASVFTTLLMAEQRTAYASFIRTVGHILAYITIFILTKTTAGSLTKLAFAFSGIPCLTLVFISIVTFMEKEYKAISPSFKFVRFSLVKNILGLGGQFFVIMLASLFIYQIINIILSRLEGPNAVTQYNIAYKYFHVLNMIVTIILTPFWSAFTEAYVKKDFIWMKRVLKKLENLWLLSIPGVIVMLFLSDYFYKLWVGEMVKIPFTLSFLMAIYILVLNSGGLYMTLINGTSKVRLQLIVYVLFSLISVPFMNQFCLLWGVEGVLIIPIIVGIVQTIIGKIQIEKIVNQSAKGIWLK